MRANCNRFEVKGPRHEVNMVQSRTSNLEDRQTILTGRGMGCGLRIWMFGNVLRD